MNYILNIETTSEKAILNLSNGGKVLTTLINENSREHASFLHSSIDRILKTNSINPSELKAIGVIAGPGSYTGIRVGLATAKGLCYALQIPMMMFNTLEVMTFSAIKPLKNKEAWFCPMIDARRMEVFTATYDQNLNAQMEPAALILDENSFKEIPLTQPIYFFGNGSAKFKKLLSSLPENFHFIEGEISSETLAAFSFGQFQKQQFADLALSKPVYIKEFFSNMKNI